MSAVAPETRHRRNQWIVAAVIVAILVAGLVGWRLHEQRGVRVGDRFDGVTAYSGQLTENRLAVPIAFGTLLVTVGAGDEVGASDGLVNAPDGMAMVEVAWASTTGTTPPVWPAASARDRRDPGADLTLVTGGRRYPIANAVTAADEGTSAVIAVQGDGSDARIESRVQGRVFSSTNGDATPRRAQQEGYVGCDGTVVPKTYSWVECTLPVYRGGYVPGLGAAPAGKEWLVVSGASVQRSERRVSMYGDDEQNAEYFPSGAPTVTFTVNGVSGHPRVAGKDEVIGDGIRPATRAWLVDPDQSSKVRMRYRLPTKIDRSQSHWQGAPATHEVDVSTTTTYPGA